MNGCLCCYSCRRPSGIVRLSCVPPSPPAANDKEIDRPKQDSEDGEDAPLRQRPPKTEKKMFTLKAKWWAPVPTGPTLEAMALSARYVLTYASKRDTHSKGDE